MEATASVLRIVLGLGAVVACATMVAVLAEWFDRWADRNERGAP